MRALGRRLTPYAALFVAAVGVFAPLAVEPGRALYARHSDLLAMHVPLATALGRSWRETGEKPLWNPLQFAGLPLAHDVQAAASYPPHALFALVDGSREVAALLSWLVVGHVVVAGWGMFAYARWSGLGTAASLVAALGFMFAGKWMLHFLLAGHYAFAGLAWLPWVMLGLDAAIRRRSIVAAGWGGVAFGLMIAATHPQLTLYAGLFLAAWTLLYVVDADRASVKKRIAVWAGFGGVVAVVGVLVAAIQLAPSLEATPLSSRGTSGLPDKPSFSTRALLAAIGPSPGEVDAVQGWEPRSGFGVVWLALAAAAPALATTAGERLRARWALFLLAAAAVFALGGAGLVQPLPVFRMFRMPARIFLVAGAPLAILGAISVQGLVDAGADRTSLRRGRRIFTVAAGLCLAWLLLAAVFGPTRGPIRPHPYWFSLVATLPLAWLLIRSDPTRFRRWRPAAWVVVLGVDLLAQSLPHLQTCDAAVVLAPSIAARAVRDRAGPLDRVLDRSVGSHQSITPLGPAVATELGLHQVRGYNALDILAYKRYLALASSPVEVRNPYNGLSNAPIVHKRILDALGVRWLVQPANPADRGVTGEVDPDADPRWRRVATDPAPSVFAFGVGGTSTLPAYEVLENLDALPRAWVVPRVEPAADDAEASRRLLATDFDPRGAAVVVGPGPGVDYGRSPGTAVVRSYQANRIKVEAEGPGLLVLADPWYPGWAATIDDAPAPAPIVRVDLLFRGVLLSTGRHSVVFRFRPRSYELGRAASIATILAVLIATIFAASASVGRSRHES